MTRLDAETAGRLARIVLGHVEREYPHKLDHVLDGPDDARTPARLHPAFHGSFDWHSCVHGHWMLARLRRRFPQLAEAEAIGALLDRRLTRANVAAELAYLERPASRGFERPYGWAWLLKLQAELTLQPETGWARTLTPLADAFAARLMSYLPKLTYPIRAGTHANTAFALRLGLDYAGTCEDAALAAVIERRAWDWFGQDAACQAWEPSGDDFLSPALMEAACLQAMTPPADFGPWFDRFLPDLGSGRPETLFTPARVSDPTDGKIAHLDGLNLSRAWCWRALATGLAQADPRRLIMEDAAHRHLQASLPAVEGDYMGEHWLASFALMALEA